MRRPEVDLARRLRRDLSLPEVMLWQRLRGKPSGLKFRRQHPIGSYVVDFYCRAASLVMEIDGERHDRGDRPVRDAHRAAFLTEQGCRVLRIAAVRILADVDVVAEAIVRLASAPLHQPAAGPPPRAGKE